MEEQFVTYENAVALKELGFDEPCFAFYAIPNVGNKLFFDIDPDDGELTSLNQNQIYHNNLSEVGRISAPLKQQIFKFFRDKYNIDGWVVPYYSSNGKFYCYTIECGVEEDLGNSEHYKLCEEAESACIDKLIEIVKNK
jgi:hypothetical protein